MASGLEVQKSEADLVFGICQYVSVSGTFIFLLFAVMYYQRGDLRNHVKSQLKEHLLPERMVQITT